jgi:hypothetical protein
MKVLQSFVAGLLVPLALAIEGLPLAAQIDSPKATLNHPVAFDISPPLRDLIRLPSSPPYNFHALEAPRTIRLRGAGRALIDEPVEQHSSEAQVSATIGVNVLGITDVDQAGPSDQNLAVGDTQVVEWLNLSYAVFDKGTGDLIAGPFEGNTLWSGFNGRCALDNNVDVIAQWDKVHHRWLMAYNDFTPLPRLACIAVSQTADATGSYYRYEYTLSSDNDNLPDYPKWGIWTNAYYQANNNLDRGYRTFVGAYPCAYNSAKLLVGDPSAEQICFQLSVNDFGLLPGDLDSPTPPPANQDEFFIGSYGMGSGNDSLYLYSMHPDFSNPSQSTITGNNLSQPITVAPYNLTCNGMGNSTCVPQLNGELLYTLGDRLMYRFAYYDDPPAAHVGPVAGPLPRQHWLVSHTVQVSGGQAGMRWYEFVAPQHKVGPTDLSVYQQGTFAPDSNWRWMGSIARDKVGDILMGYSLSSSTMYPAVAFTGRVPTDPLGTMEGEQVIYAGTGAQINTGGSWGDYSSLQLDQADGCTFWYTNEYYITTSSDNFNTRLASIKFNGCH